MTSKMKVGKALNSDAIIADANCTKTCFYLSFMPYLNAYPGYSEGYGFIALCFMIYILTFKTPYNIMDV